MNLRTLYLPALALIALLLIVVQLELTPYAIDDAYIHFRIVANYLATGQPYFQVGEPLLTTSSPVWTLLLTALFSVTSVNIPAVAILEALLALAAAATWATLLRLTVSFRSPLVLGLTFVSFLAVTFSAATQLMETPLALLLLGLGLILYQRQDARAFLLLVLAAGTRLEYSVPLVVVFMDTLLNSWQRNKNNAAAPQTIKVSTALLHSLLAAIPLALFLIYYYGALLPHTITAKSQIYSVTFIDFLTVIGLVVFGEFQNIPIHLDLVSGGPLYGLVTLLAALLLPCQLRNRASGRITLLVHLSGSIILLAYLWQRVLVFTWYPPLFILPLLFGLLVLLLEHPAKLGKSLYLTAFLATIGLLTPFLFNFGRNISAGLGHPEQYAFFASGGRVRTYLQLGAELSQKIPQGRVAAAEIGGLGFSFSGQVLDGCGLVTPAALKYHPLPIPSERANGLVGAIPLKFLQDNRPEAIVSLPLFNRGFLNSADRTAYRHTAVPLLLAEDQQRLPLAAPERQETIDVFLRPTE